ncbi:hypothetical protein [Janthinobacterium sp. MDB2-8]|uniref:hypothetical protein n=1 Tax=Janthinobacterium sp. MDB2-8 TaxID=1259338 RepID=UPI003F1EDFFA
MYRIITLIWPILLMPIVTQAADLQLFRLIIPVTPVENGKILDMEFKEVAREADSSTVRATRRSGGSVSSSMFILRGMCGLARSRGKQHFVTEQLAGESNQYKVTFPETPPDPGKGFTIAQCELLQY